MNKFFLIITCLIITFQSIAQFAEVKLSPEFKLKKNITFEEHLSSDETGHYVYFKKSKNFKESTIALAKYDNKFEQDWNVEYYADESDIRTFGLKALKDKFVWLLSKESTRNQYDYHISPIDKNGEIGKRLKVVSIKTESSRDKPAIIWELSEDTSKMLVFNTLDKNKKKLDFEYSVTVIDSEMNKLWSKYVKLRKSQEQIEVISSVVGNDGTHYMLVYEYDDRDAKTSKRGAGNKKVAAYDLMIYKLSDGMKTPEAIELNLNDKFARGGSIKVDKEGNIVCIGMFSNLKRGNTNGIFYLKIDDQGNVLNSKIKEFSKKDLEFLGERNTGKNRSGDSGIDGMFSFGEQLLLDDGTVMVSAEENYVTRRTDSRGNTTIVYHSKDIIVITFEADGTVSSIKLIPKRQASQSKMFISHKAMAVDNLGAFFFYNDDIDNIERDLDKQPKKISSFRDCVTTCAFINKEGKVERQALLKNKDVDALLLPTACKKVNSNTLFFAGMKAKLFAKSNFRIGTIEIQ